MTDEYTDIWVCVDCYWIHHYGDISPDYRDRDNTDERNDECLAAYMKLGGNQYVTDNTDSETGEGIDEFSWSPCQCCRSHLGGNRYRLAVWPQPEEAQ